MKRYFIFILKIIFGFVITMAVSIAYYFGSAYLLSRIPHEKESNTAEEVEIYLLTNGVHTDIVMPVRNEVIDWSKYIKFENTEGNDTLAQFLAVGWGDKGFYQQTPTWADLKASVAFNAAFGLSSTAIHTTYYRSMTISESCKKIPISLAQYKRLVSYVNNSLEKDSNGQNIRIITNANYGTNDAFYEARGKYSFVKTCNTWTNNALKASGQKCCLWTPFDTGIFLYY